MDPFDIVMVGSLVLDTFSNDHNSENQSAADNASSKATNLAEQLNAQSDLYAQAYSTTDRSNSDYTYTTEEDTNTFYRPGEPGTFASYFNPGGNTPVAGYMNANGDYYDPEQGERTSSGEGDGVVWQDTYTEKPSSFLGFNTGNTTIHTQKVIRKDNRKYAKTTK
jgi:hypothetical protein